MASSQKAKSKFAKCKWANLSRAYLPFAFFFFADWKLVFYKNSISTHQNLTLLDKVFFFYKRNRYKLISGRTDVIQRPVLVVFGKNMPQAIRTVYGGDAAIFPVKQLDAVV